MKGITITEKKIKLLVNRCFGQEYVIGRLLPNAPTDITSWFKYIIVSDNDIKFFSFGNVSNINISKLWAVMLKTKLPAIVIIENVEYYTVHEFANGKRRKYKINKKHWEKHPEKETIDLIKKNEFGDLEGDDFGRTI